MSDLTTVHTFEIYDGDATVTVERSPEKDNEVMVRLIDWYRKNSAVDGEVIFQSDKCHETACEFLAELADEVLEFKTEWNGGKE